MFRPCFRFIQPRVQPFPRRSYSKPVTRHELPSRKRIISVLVAFAAGASIYLFLPDPSLPVPPIDGLPLSPRHFSVTTVISNEDSGTNTKLLKLAVPPHLLPSAQSLFTPIWSVFIKDDDIQVERPYTPLYGIDKNGYMMFWIKKYPRGEVGRWLHSKKPGENIELRGPLQTWPWKTGQWDDVIMISGGTGITPFVQLFNTHISKSTSTSGTKFTLLHGSRTLGDLPPALILEPMIAYAAEHPDKFDLHIFVESLDGSALPTLAPRLINGTITETGLKRCLGSERQESSWWKRPFQKNESEDPVPRRALYLVCGPEGMISAVAGPYGRNFSQGPVGGILGSMGLTSQEVYKL